MLKMKLNPIIGIVILHFGNTLDTAECLSSLSKIPQRKFKLKVYLVDNDIRNRFDKKIIPSNLESWTFVSGKNLGFPEGVNIGIQKALGEKCDYIHLLNNDTVVKDGLYSEAIAYFNKNDDIGVISPMINYYDAPNKIWCTDGKLNKTFLFSHYPYMNKSIDLVSLPDIIYSDFGAASLLIKSEVFQKIGLMDKKYFLNVEDIEWCLRAKKTGYKLIYITKPYVLHKVSVNTGTRGSNMLSPLNSYLYARNFFYLLGDHRDYFNLITGLMGQFLIRMPFFIILRTNSINSKIAYLKGLVHGVKYLLNSKIVKINYAKIK